MRYLKTLLFLLVLNVGLTAQVLHQFAKPLAAYWPELPQIPEGHYLDTTLYFCTDHPAMDSLYYQFDSLGRLQAYSSAYPSASGLIYAEHRLSYEGPQLKSWHRLPNQTNNGRSYYFTYDSLRRFQSLEVHNTSSYGADFDYSVDIISRQNQEVQYRFQDKNGKESLRIDFKDSLGTIDSTWIQDSWASGINKKIRYRTRIQGNQKQVIVRTFYLETTYYGHWFYPAGYEPGPYSNGYPTGPRGYSYLPQGGRLVQFVLDSVVIREKPLSAAQYYYHYFKDWKLTQYQDKHGKVAYNYDSLGVLKSTQSPPSGASQHWAHLQIGSLDTGEINSSCQGNCIGDLKIYSCSTNPLASVTERSIDWELYPNPSSGLLQLELPAGIKSLRILDSSGKLYLQKEIQTSSANLELSHLPKGLYVIEIQTEGVISRRRWVKGC